MTGRPQWIPADAISQEAREIASNGITAWQISECLGISEATLCDKPSDYKEFMDAIKNGRAKWLNMVFNASLKKATQGNVKVMIYYLKVRDREN